MRAEEQLFAYKELEKSGQAFFIDNYEDADRIIEALEKQIPKEPYYDGDGYAPGGSFVWDEWLCPECNSRFEVDYDEYDYCPNCGQAIKWD